MTLSNCDAELCALLATINAVEGILLTLAECPVVVESVVPYCDNKAATDVILSQKNTSTANEFTPSELKL